MQCIPKVKVIIQNKSILKSPISSIISQTKDQVLSDHKEKKWYVESKNTHKHSSHIKYIENVPSVKAQFQQKMSNDPQNVYIILFQEDFNE